MNKTPKKPGRFSAGDAAQMASLREAGWSYERIAARFDCSPANVHYHCMREGAISPNTKPGAPIGPMVIVCKNGVTQRRFTHDEDAEILRRVDERQSYKTIANAMGRAPTSIRIRAMMLELRDDGYAQSKTAVA